jgi:hypothetical protein
MDSDGKHIDEFSQLHTLILDKNELASLVDFPPLPQVTTVWLNNNRFANLVDFCDEVAATFPCVEYLSTMKNPVAPDIYGGSSSDADAYQRYRYYVIFRLKRLNFLDALPVDADERARAEQVGERMAPRRPTAAAVKDAASQRQATLAAAPSPTATRPKETQAAAFLGKGKPRYDGSNSEGNRFILNQDL